MLREGGVLGRQSDAFTLQWHLTNACSQHCSHCYDRSPRPELSLDAARAVLRDLTAFCWRKRVSGRVSLTGGDPLLYAHFWELYEAVADAGLPVAILGNPIDEDCLLHLLSIQRPSYFQVSLEGRRAHNDRVRGAGHYDRVLAFLDLAQRHGLRTHVMLTLTRDNLEEVLPLGEALRGCTERLVFNRLAQVGEAAGLAAPRHLDYVRFVERYLDASRHNPLLGWKDNLINVVLMRRGRPSFPGCTGHGCGAGFDFVALLPDGEVHACRKFPSRIGSLCESRLDALYASPEAQRYRSGSQACRACRLRPSCGGCMAVTYGRGLMPLRDRDPDCFYLEGAFSAAGP